MGAEGKGGEWWQVIQAMAELVAEGFDYEELESEVTQEILAEAGYSALAIDQALDWLEMASVSGNISEVFAMAQETVSDPYLRMSLPSERLYFGDNLWKVFQRMRWRGIISNNLAEKMIESVRSLDTRDWEEQDLYDFLFEVLAVTLPQSSEKMLKRLIRNVDAVSELYC